MDRATDETVDDREEPLEPWVRRALLTMEEGEGADGPLGFDLRVLSEAGGEGADDREEPVAPRMRRALLAIDADEDTEGPLAIGLRLFDEISDTKPLHLVNTRMLGDGLVFYTYEFEKN